MPFARQEAARLEELRLLALEAAEWLGAAAATGARIELTLEPFERGLHDRTEAALRAALGDGVFAARVARGEQLDVEQAVEEALRYLGADAVAG